MFVAGPGSDFFEEPVAGCEPVALELEVVPECPPGPVLVVAADRAASSSMVLIPPTMGVPHRPD